MGAEVDSFDDRFPRSDHRRMLKRPGRKAGDVAGKRTERAVRSAKCRQHHHSTKRDVVKLPALELGRIV